MAETNEKVAYEDELIALRDGRDLSVFDLTSVDYLTAEDLELIFTLARKFKELKTAKLSLCKGHSQVNVFFESSTRTQSSFDLSAKHLGMDTTNVGSGNRDKKGESILDTIETLGAYNVHTLIIRSAEAGVAEFVARHVPAAVVNAGDGWHEHPTQGLLDALTMLDHFGTVDLEGKTVLVVGDLLHSRVFGSLVRILVKLGASVRVAAPRTMMPAHVERFGCTHFDNVDEALFQADVVYTLRVQEERGAGGFIPTLREYSKTFGISEKRLSLAAKDAILMHPGPVVRDIDVHSALVSRHPQSRVLAQVENGMAVRKAVLYLLAMRSDERFKPYIQL